MRLQDLDQDTRLDQGEEARPGIAGRSLSQVSGRVPRAWRHWTGYVLAVAMKGVATHDSRSPHYEAIGEIRKSRRSRSIDPAPLRRASRATSPGTSCRFLSHHSAISFSVGYRPSSSVLPSISINDPRSPPCPRPSDSTSLGFHPTTFLASSAPCTGPSATGCRLFECISSTSSL